MNPLELKKDAVKLADKIRRYTRNQRSLWRTLPKKAIESDGIAVTIKEKNHHLRFWKTWPLIGNYSGQTIAVYLKTGELVLESIPRRKKAPDWAVIELVWDLDKIDARKVIQDRCKKY